MIDVSPSKLVIVQNLVINSTNPPYFSQNIL